MTLAPYPPGPAGLPLLGNVPAFRRDALGLMTACAREHGPVAQIRLGPQRMYVLSRSEEIEQVLVTDAARYRKSKILTVMGRMVLGRALDALDGERWVERRRTAAPAFHRRRADAEAAAVIDAAERSVAGWRDGETRRFDRDALAMMLAAASVGVCGTTLTSAEAHAVGRAMTTALAGFGGRVKLGLPIPDWLPVRDNRRMRRGMRVIHRVVGAAIAAARQGGGADDSVLATLLRARAANGAPALDERELVDEIAVMFALGGHQVALALTWACHLLAQHPDADAALHRELATVLASRTPTAADVAELRYATAVVDETLRLYPPFFLVVREAAVDGVIGGYRVDRGTTIGLSTWATHRSPRYFDDPESFRPERWTDGLARRLPRFAYFPYGGGARICIARAFVHQQLVLALATIARRFRFEPAPGHVVAPQPETALSLRDGLAVVVHRR